jgi:hypothetical protein
MCHNARANTRVDVLERLETRAREEFCLRCGATTAELDPLWHFLTGKGRFELLRKGWFGSIERPPLFGRGARAGEKRKFTR